jgi:hypothetical protein
MATDTSWQKWETLRRSADPDPIEVLQAVACFQRYFEAVENEAIKVARAQGRSWQEIGLALGRTRQALWQRVGSPKGEQIVAARWKEIKESVEDWWANTLEVQYRTGLPPSL